MDKNNPKEGVSVREIEEFTKKHRFEVFFCLAFILACFFSFMWGPWWSIFAAGIGAVIGILLSDKVSKFSKSIFQFVFKHEQTTQLVLGVVFLILAIFLAPLYFLILGVHGGKDLHNFAKDTYNNRSQ